MGSTVKPSGFDPKKKRRRIHNTPDRTAEGTTASLQLARKHRRTKNDRRRSSFVIRRLENYSRNWRAHNRLLFAPNLFRRAVPSGRRAYLLSSAREHGKNARAGRNWIEKEEEEKNGRRTTAPVELTMTPARASRRAGKPAQTNNNKRR